MSEQIYLTKRGMKKLQEQCKGIDDEIRIVHMEMSEISKLDINVRDSSEYSQLSIKATRELPEKRAKILQMLRSAAVIEDTKEYNDFIGDKVILGSKVTVMFDDELDTYIIVGHDEGDYSSGTVSANAPIIQAILGKAVGETLKFNDFKVKIASVEKHIFA